MTKLFKFITSLGLVFSLSAPVAAQGLFDAVVTVNGEAVTQYELNQRAKFLSISRQPGNLRSVARDALIEDRLKMAAARQAGLSLTPEALERELETFAQRSGLTFAELSRNLRGLGVDAATIRDFVEVGITWRELIRSRFAGRGEPSAAEIDRALAANGPRGGLRVLLSEIILAARPGEEAATAKAQAARISQFKSTARFSNSARALSVSRTADKGGDLGWQNLNDLPPPLRPIVSALRPGQVTAPLEVENAIILFQLRAVEETTVAPPEVAAIEYARVSGPSATVALAQQEADVCDDLYGIKKRNPDLVFEIESRQPSAIPTGVAVQLAVLDPNEKNIVAAENGTANMLMVCARVFSQTEDTSREEITTRLRSRRLESLANGYLAELRATAVIVNN